MQRSALFGDLIKGLARCLSRLALFVCGLAAAAAHCSHLESKQHLPPLLL